MNDVTVKIDRDVMAIVAQLAGRFDLSQKVVIQNAVAQFSANHSNGEPIMIPPRAHLLRENAGQSETPVAPTNAEPYKIQKKRKKT